MEKPSYLCYREKIKNKFRKEGLKTFLDHEVLDLLLTYSISRKDTKKLGWELIKNFASFSGVLDANSFELQKIEGVGPQSAMLINIIREVITRYSLNKIKIHKNIKSQVELYKYFIAHLRNKKQEFFEVMFLDKKLRLIATEVVAEGNIDSASISPRKIIELVLRHGAKHIICVHNHPSGDPSPSAEDVFITEKLKVVLDVLHADIKDHIIVGSDRIYSIESHSYIEI